MAGIGVDGCRSGWLVVTLDDEGTPGIQRVDTLAEVAGLAAGYPRILLDMPIGFLEGGPDGRTCERLARRRLSPLRHSSVFTPPCRPALYADPAEASAVNFRHTGKKLSRQTINILPKMREVDTYLRSLPAEEQDRWCEAHPEVIFGAWYGGPLPESKKTEAGRPRRLQLLAAQVPRLAEWLPKQLDRFPRSQVLPDDILDAAALAVAAHLMQARPAGFRQLPASPGRDGEGLLMRMVYWEDQEG
jgi:predicted RNase H-like nuclease